jgi:hypothetical protein
MGKPPAWAELPEKPGELRHADLSELILEVSLPDDIQARVYRDGMFAFDLGALASSDPFEHFENGARLMNAHLACLWSVAPVFFKCRVVTR